ncbi:MAG: hypothetical protein AB4352_25070 [Hormoscilla sp.]
MQKPGFFINARSPQGLAPPARSPQGQKPGFSNNFGITSKRFVQKPGFFSCPIAPRSRPKVRNRVSLIKLASEPQDLCRNPVSLAARSPNLPDRPKARNRVSLIKLASEPQDVFRNPVSFANYQISDLH